MRPLLVAASLACCALASVSGQLTQFPYCDCNSNPKASSYYTLPVVEFTPPSTYTWTLGTHPCLRPQNPCCKADVQKFEISTYAACRAATASTAEILLPGSSQFFPTTNPQFYHPTSAAPGVYSYKITALGLNYSQIAGTKIRITFTSGCTSLMSLCDDGGRSVPAGTCVTALFSSNLRCCPVSPTGQPAPPPPSPPPPSPPPPPPPSPPPPPPPSPPPPPPPSPPPPGSPPPSPPPPPPPSPPPPQSPPPSPPPPSPPPPPPPVCSVCLTVNVAAGGVTVDTCAALAVSAQGLYSTGVAYASNFACTLFSPTSATVCAEALTDADAATYLTNFEIDEAAFGVLTVQFKLICADSATATSCVDRATRFVSCPVAKEPSPPPPLPVAPSPMPNISFPYCNCIKTPGSTPFSFSPNLTGSVINFQNRVKALQYNFQIVIGPGVGAGAKQLRAFKAEFYLKESLRHEVLGSVFNGTFQPPSWGNPKEQPNTFKMKFGGDEGITAAEANGIVVSLILRSPTTIVKASALSATSLPYAIFSKNNKWCPTSAINIRNAGGIIIIIG